MTLGQVARVAAVLTAILALFPRIAFHAGPVPVAMPTAAVIAAVEVLAVVLLIGMAWRSCAGFRPRMTWAAS